MQRQNHLTNPNIVEIIPGGGVRYMDPASKLRENRILQFFHPVNDDSCAIAQQHLLLMMNEDESKPIKFLLNTPGGTVQTGLGLIDQMELVREKLEANGAYLSIEVFGMAASMGSVMMAVGSKGHRKITKRSSVMVHQLGGGSGQHLLRDQIDNIEHSKYLNDTLMEILARRTGQTFDSIKQRCSLGDTFFYADKCIQPAGAVTLGLPALNAFEFGIADGIVGASF